MQNRIGRQDKLLISLNRLLSSKIPCFQKLWGRKHYSSALCEQFNVQVFLGQCLLMLICCISEELKFYHSITLICFFSGKTPFQYICLHLKALKSQALWIQLLEIHFTKFMLTWEYFLENTIQWPKFLDLKNCV